MARCNINNFFVSHFLEHCFIGHEKYLSLLPTSIPDLDGVTNPSCSSIIPVLPEEAASASPVSLLHNLATIFGPNMLFADKGGAKATMATGTVDVMAQAGILYFFLTRRARGEPIQIVERQV